MKKILFLSSIFFAVCHSSFAQTEKGRFTISGATNVKSFFSKLKPNTTDVVDQTVKSQNYQFNLGAGYFVVDNLAVGINGAYEYEYHKTQIALGAFPGDDNPVYGEAEQDTWSVVPQIACYLPVEGNLRPVVVAGFGYITSKERNNQTNAPGKIVSHFDGTSFNIGAGASYFLNPSVSIDLGFRYWRNNLKNKVDTRQKILQDIYGLLAGVSVYF